MSANALSLFQIEEELACWLDTLSLVETDEAAAAEVQQRVLEYLDKAVAKRDRFAAFLAHLEHLEQLAKAEEDRLWKRREALRASRERLEAYAVSAMQTLGVRKLEGNTSTLKLAKNPDSIVILDSAQIPDWYLHPQKPAPPREPDKAAIKAAIKAGETVPGADVKFGGDRLCRE